MEVHRIPGPWPGQLAILARPRGNDWLIDEVRGWREAGVDVVVSLLTAPEIAELGLTEERQLATSEGLGFVSFPIRDYSVPNSVDSVLGLSQELDKLLSVGKCVGIHCRQSVGRSGLIAACLLVTAGENPTEAIEHVKAGRGASVPDTIEQRDWVHALAENLKSQTNLTIAT